LLHATYSKARFVLVASPSGITLAPEGGAHQSILTGSLGIEVPDLCAWEPVFAREVEWLLLDALRRIQDREQGRAVYLRLSTKVVDQALLEPALARLGEDELRAQALLGGYRLVDHRDRPEYEPGANVVNLAAVGVMAPEAVAASRLLEAEDPRQRGGADESPTVLRGWRARLDAQVRRRGPRPPSWLRRLVPVDEVEGQVPIVSVLDGHSTRSPGSGALGVPGAARGRRLRPVRRPRRPLPALRDRRGAMPPRRASRWPDGPGRRDAVPFEKASGGESLTGRTDLGYQRATPSRVGGEEHRPRPVGRRTSSWGASRGLSGPREAFASRAFHDRRRSAAPVKEATDMALFGQQSRKDEPPRDPEPRPGDAAGERAARGGAAPGRTLRGGLEEKPMSMSPGKVSSRSWPPASRSRARSRERQHPRGGRFKGNVNVKGELTIEPGASIDGEVKADSVLVGGEVRGHIACKSRVEFKESGTLIGDLKAGSLAVAAGSKMRGKVEFGWKEGELDAATPPDAGALPPAR
jgi:hypothetical protein